MGQIFISYYRADEDVAIALATGLESVGLITWYYTRDSRPGPSYLLQIAAAITASDVLLVVVSRESVESEQITSEIVQGFEQKKHLVPILYGLSHLEFQPLQKEWRAAFRAATSITIPHTGVEPIIPSIIDGLKALGITPGDGYAALKEQELALPPPSLGGSRQVSVASPPRNPQSDHSDMAAQLECRFDHISYPLGEDPLVYCIADFQLRAESVLQHRSDDERVEADIGLILDVSGSMDRPNRYPLLKEAVRHFLTGLGANDRVAVTLFTDQSKTVIPFTDGDIASADPDHIIKSMDSSGILFGPNTLLAPALRLSLDAFRTLGNANNRARRVYVMTDGELYDYEESKDALYGYRPESIEVHVYGFGEDFSAAALKRLVSDQIGGTIKPILSEENITRTFAHVAAVNRRLVGHNGKMTILFPTHVVCGDAWVYQPHGRYLGPIVDRKVEYVFGGIEEGRTYSLLFEARISPSDDLVASMEASWVARDSPVKQTIHVYAPRGAEPSEHVADVRRAIDILLVLRSADDKDSQLASFKARRELAILESRDPELIAALDKVISEFGNASFEVSSDVDLPSTVDLSSKPRFVPRMQLTGREQQILESDSNSVVPVSFSQMRSQKLEDSVVDALNFAITYGKSPDQIVGMAIGYLVEFVKQGYDKARAENLLEELCRYIGIPRRTGRSHSNELKKHIEEWESGAY